MNKAHRALLGGFLLSFSGGATYSWGVFTVPLMELFGWNKYEANLSFTVFMLVFALFMLPAGMLADRYGYRAVSRAGALLFLPAYLLASLVTRVGHSWWLPLTHGLLGGIGCACVYAVIAPAVREAALRNPALAVSGAVMGFGLASVFLAPLKSSLLIPGLGVSGTLAILGLAVSVVAFSASFLMPEKAPLAGQTAIPPLQVLSHTLRDPGFYPVWLVFALSVVGGFLSMGLFPSYARLSIGVSPEKAALVVALFAAVNGFGRPFAGLLAEKAGFAPVLGISGALQFMFLLLLSLLPPSWPLLLSVAGITGWSFAVVLGLYPSFTASRLGTAQLGTRYGLVFTGFGLGSLALTGGSLLYDLSGSFRPAFLGAAAASLVSFVVLILLVQRKTAPQQG